MGKFGVFQNRLKGYDGFPALWRLDGQPFSAVKNTFIFRMMAGIITFHFQKTIQTVNRRVKGKSAMNIAVMSDSHDHIWNLRKALDLIKAENCRHIIHCGDFVAPFMFKELEKAGVPVHCVFGNNDGDKALLTRFALQSNGLIALDAVVGELDLEGFRIAFTHEWVVAEGLAASGKHHLVCFGHSHRHEIRETGEVLVLNPGEIMGKDGDPGFCIVDTATRKARRVLLP